MAFKIGKDRAAVWTPTMPEYPEVRFKIRALTPLISEQVYSDHVSAVLINEDGKNKLQQNVRGFGMMRAQAKAVVEDWEGIIGDDSMGPLNGQPIPCNDKFKGLLFDVWDDGGVFTRFVTEQSARYTELRDAELKNSQKPSATS